MAYVYWFDEPDPKDYAFVRSGMERLKRYAPGMPRMLTEEPSDELAGAVDIWCPVTPNYDHDGGREAPGARRAVLVVRLLRPEGPVLHAVHRPSGHGAARLALADVAAEDRRHAGLGDRTTGPPRRPFPTSRRTPTKTRWATSAATRRRTGTKQLLGQRRRAVHLSAAGRPPCRARRARAGARAAGLQHPLGDAPRRRRGLRVPVPAARAGSTSARQACRPKRCSRIRGPAGGARAITKDMTTFTTDPAPIYARRAAVAEAIERLE